MISSLFFRACRTNMVPVKSQTDVYQPFRRYRFSSSSPCNRTQMWVWPAESFTFWKPDWHCGCWAKAEEQSSCKKKTVVCSSSAGITLEGILHSVLTRTANSCCLGVTSGKDNFSNYRNMVSRFSHVLSVCRRDLHTSASLWGTLLEVLV